MMLMIATGKGLVIYRRKAKNWAFDQVHFLGMPVSVVQLDPHNQTWWVCLDHKHWGPKIHYSADQGRTWTEVRAPKYPAHTEIKAGVPATLRYLWTMGISHAHQPKAIYLGTEPGGLFQSVDQGENFELIESLWNHPSREKHWFGGGRNHAGIHSIVIDPRDHQHIYIGVSCAGVFETHDGGQSWAACNQGLRADFLPNPFVEVGHDPHLLLMCPTKPDILWQQNHCGVFRSEDAGKHWIEVTDPERATGYGFCLAIDEQDPDQAWVIPVTSDDKRVAVNQALAVFHTYDAGKTWTDYREGLPQAGCFDIVLRHALDKKGNIMVFGTSTGNLFGSEDYGKTWQALNHYLPDIYALKLIED
ncbi:MAG: glycosyl hydrolase [Microscillaceae bacterium]|nr:glycosyl hydrolase [Microscillaceae bacterium]